MCVGFMCPQSPRFQGLSKEATMQHVQSAAYDSAPSYVRHERQPLATGTYHPLAKSNETLSPVDFRARRRAALYTHKNALCTAPSRKSIFTSAAPASSPHILQMFLQLRTHKAMPLPPIPCHPAMSPRRKRTPSKRPPQHWRP